MNDRDPIRAGSSTADDVLLRRIVEGDEAALSTLYRRYVGGIFRFILAQVRNVADAEDLTSETFARMLVGIDGFRGDASFKNWLYQIARNAVRNFRRDAGYRRTAPLSPKLALAPDTSAGADYPAKLERVLAILSPLPPRYRQVLELRFLEERTIEETAEQMGVTVGNAKVLQHRALRKAASMVEEEMDLAVRET